MGGEVESARVMKASKPESLILHWWDALTFFAGVGSQCSQTSSPFYVRQIRRTFSSICNPNSFYSNPHARTLPAPDGDTQGKNTGLILFAASCYEMKGR